jgi:transposase
MEQWSEIQHKVLVDKVSKRQIRRDYGVSARTLEKMLANPEPPGYRKSTRKGSKRRIC